MPDTENKLDAQDIEALSLFAYNRLLMHRYEDALLLYTFLTHCEPQETKWAMGKSFCLVNLKRGAEAQSALAQMKEAPADGASRRAFERLTAYAAHQQKHAKAESVPA